MQHSHREELREQRTGTCANEAGPGTSSRLHPHRSQLNLTHGAGEQQAQTTQPHFLLPSLCAGVKRNRSTSKLSQNCCLFFSKLL